MYGGLRFLARATGKSSAYPAMFVNRLSSSKTWMKTEHLHVPSHVAIHIRIKITIPITDVQMFVNAAH